MSYTMMTPDEAAALIQHGERIGLGGFTAAGAPKVVTAALAVRAKAEHEAGRPFQVEIYSGASTSSLADGVLSEARAISRRTPYQSTPEMRKGINSGEISYYDMHLSVVSQNMRYGFLPRVQTLIVEAANLTEDGEITLTTGIGNAPTYARLADRIIVELNSYHKPELKDMHDLYVPADPPHREALLVTEPRTRIGSGVLKVDPAKIVAVVNTHETDHIAAFKPGTPLTDKIGENVVKFLEDEYAAGRIPPEFLPLQSGVGNVANAVLASIGRSATIPPIQMYTEVLQDSVARLMQQGRCSFASSCSMTVSDDMLKEIYENFDFFKDKILLRPQEISNNPEIGRRLGLICINTAIEADLFGNVNSTHFYGSTMMNGLGGSGDFARCAALTIFTCPSVAKGGAISSIVPMVSHTDHPEHDVDIIVTEHGVADLRGKSPRERAELIIDNCADPEYRPLLREYLALTPQGHTPHNLAKAFEMHNVFLRTGDMRNADFKPAAE